MIPLSDVQILCTSIARPDAHAALPLCRPSERKRRSQTRKWAAKTEGKIKGRGTVVREMLGLHMAERGTRLRWPCAAVGAESSFDLENQRAAPAGARRCSPENEP